MSDSENIKDRILSKRTGGMLVRNTVVSVGVFLLSLGILWLLVQFGGMAKLPAAAIGFVVAQTIHYMLGRTWIFRGTDRSVVNGYAFFIVNGLIGLAITLVLFDLFLRYTPLHYLLSRAIVSVVAGLAMFFLNGIFNFKRI